MTQGNSSANDRFEVRRGHYPSGALLRVIPYENGKVHGIERDYEIATLNIAHLTLYDKDQKVSSIEI